MNKVLRVFQRLWERRKKPRVASPRRFRSLRIGELEPRVLLAAYHFDFGTSTSPVASGYSRTTDAAYTSSAGYGWTNTSGLVEDSRSEGGSLLQDFVAGKDNTFRVNLPDGVYKVTLTLGDSSEARDQIDIYVNGKRVASNQSTGAGTYEQVSYVAQVTNGQLSVRLVDHGGPTVRWTLNALDIASASSTDAAKAAVGQSLVVNAGLKQTAKEGSAVTLSGSASGAGTLSYAWDFGDGKTATGTLKPSHTYADDGKYLATLTVTDASGMKSTSTTTVAVGNVAPQVKLTGVPSTTPEEGDALTLGSSVSDPSSADKLAGFKYSWTVTKNGKAFASGTSSKITFTPNDNGTYVASLKVTDKDGGSSTASTTLTVKNIPPRPNALGAYKGVMSSAVEFVGIARDHSTADAQAGYTYSWNFGDGKTASGATVKHTYATAGTYTVTLTVTDKDGAKQSTQTTATIAKTASSTPANEYAILSSNLVANTVYSSVSADEMASDGAWGVNADWEQGKSSSWYIEQQRYGENLIIDGVLHNNTSKIALGFKVFDWGFAHQASDGSFAGTNDAFHSTSFFVEAVAHACLLLKQSPYASQYASKISSYTAKVYKAAQWMASSDVWANGIKNDAPYTHRYYLVADAMALTSQLVGGDSTLMGLARSRINDALARQQSNGVNLEDGGYDVSYQTVGLYYAELWSIYFPKESVTASVKTMIGKGLAWEQSKLLSYGKIDTTGSTRVGSETGPSGTVKDVDWRKAVTAFGYWYEMTGASQWQTDGQKVAQYYFKTY